MPSTAVNSGTRPMMFVSEEPWTLHIEECCGLYHEPQVIAIEIPVDSETNFWMRDAYTTRCFPVQRSAQHPETGFLYIELRPFEKLALTIAEPDGDAVRIMPRQLCMVDRQAAVLANGNFAIRVQLGTEDQTVTPSNVGAMTPGPISAWRVLDGPWRGHSYFDAQGMMSCCSGEIVEQGPLRVCYQYHVDFTHGQSYDLAMTIDAGQCFAHLRERFSMGSADQLVWDLHGVDLPTEMYLLDTSAGHTRVPLLYHMDQCLARLAAWTQFSQLFDLSDGYACRIGKSNDVIGFVTLSGGDWRGNRLNFIEGWMRRQLPGDPASRRGLPAGAKADSMPSYERILARGTARCEAHFTFEAWIGSGERVTALVLTQKDHLLPSSGDKSFDAPLGHFELKPDRERYRTQQGLLRRLFIRRGMMPLQAQLAMTFQTDRAVPPPADSLLSLDFFACHHVPEMQDHETAIPFMVDYLRARVYGFWEGSGAIYSNCVVGRRIGPLMSCYAILLAEGKLTDDVSRECQAQLLFLAQLNASEHFYPGHVAMLPANDADSHEPTMAGMANQNFYTDVIALFGNAAQVFPDHPQAGVWRERFGERWHRQLAFHQYPDSGIWEESHTYYQHVLLTVLPVLVRRRLDGVDNDFANPVFQRLVGAVLKQVTPRDRYFSDERHVIAFGDHSVSIFYRAIYLQYAEAFAPYNPQLASELVWLYREMGGECPSSLQATPPALCNEYAQGLGMCFRTVDATGKDSLLALRSGGAWGHHHEDDASLQFFAFGQTLITDAGFGENGSLKALSGGHSRWTVKGIEPLNCLWNFTRGWLVDHEVAGRFPYAVAYSPVIMRRDTRQPIRIPIIHTRTVIQLAATSYLIIDAAESHLSQRVRFHIAGDAVQLVEQGIVANYPGHGHLAIRQLSPEFERCRISTCRPSGKSELVTTEACFVTGTSSQSVFLVTAFAEEATTPSVTLNTDGTYLIQSTEFSAHVCWAAPNAVAITDVATAETVHIKYRDIDSDVVVTTLAE